MSSYRLAAVYSGRPVDDHLPGYSLNFRDRLCEGWKRGDPDTPEKWTVDNGLLTPTLKPKRAKILEHYRDRVAELYRGHGG